MIEVKNLTKEFKETKALDNVSLRFATGKIHGLIGRNGSGHHRKPRVHRL